ncbi:MAG: response regulator transcription factor [Campylobacterales bacterium]
MVNVLMVEDDSELAEILSEFLATKNIAVTNYEDPYSAKLALSGKRFDLIILDLTLPGLDGLELCKDIREQYDTPIIISSARSDIDDKLEGLQNGADDYLPKPYDPKELEARIEAVLRRYTKSTPPTDKEISLNYQKLEAKLQERDLNLTRAEFEILSYLLKHKSRAITREELLENIDSIDYDSGLKSIDVIIGRLRHKIGENPKEPKYIKSVRGVGYKLI